MTKSLESAIQRGIIQYLRGLDDTYVLNVGGGASTAKGTPDILACVRGRFVAVEVKRQDSGYGLTKPQELRMKTIERAGGIAIVAVGIPDVKNVVDWIRANY